ncbi:MAG: hypothetical protein JW973_02140 [Bacteroidales bacterium]|nr:hypothetical protein [Bacteroidales bacterium]
MRFLLVSLFILVVIALACNEKMFTGSVDCDKCYSEKPEVEKLFVYLTFNEDIDEIPLVLYKGDIEDNHIDYIDTAWAANGNPYWVMVEVEQDYSIRAEYRLARKTIYAVDETRLQVKHVSDVEVCDVECWVVEDNTMSLELKDDFMEKGP